MIFGQGLAWLWLSLVCSTMGSQPCCNREALSVDVWWSRRRSITFTTTAEWVSAGNHDATAELLQHSRASGLWVSTSYISSWCIQTNWSPAALFFRLLIELLSWGILYNSLLFTAYLGCDKGGFVLESAVLAEATGVAAAVLMNLQIALSSCVRISLQRRGWPVWNAYPVSA